jgi:hypothetical protein
MVTVRPTWKASMPLLPPAASALDVDPSALLYAVGGIALFSVLIAMTRSPGLRLLWRLGRVACALVPVAVAGAWWSASDPTRALSDGLSGRSAEPVGPALGMSFDLPQLPHWDVRPPGGFEVAALAWAMALGLFFLLSLRTARRTTIGR